MKVLYVISGNKKEISPIFANQLESLKPFLTSTKIFQVKGNGLFGYLKNIKPLRKAILEFNPDLVHAHYSFCGMIASVAGSRKTVVSLMGSDVKQGGIFKYLVRFFQKYYWHLTIVKSEEMKRTIRSRDIHVVPNGVNVDLFKPLNVKECREKLSWKSEGIHILFAANAENAIKNYPLFKKSVELIQHEMPEMIIHSLHDIPNDEMPLYYNAADVVCLASKWEGSPNVIKEAMACNRPIVSTNVGDVMWLCGTERGHFVTESDPRKMASELKKAIIFSKEELQTNGRDRLTELGLDSHTVAKKISSIYQTVIDT